MPATSGIWKQGTPIVECCESKMALIREYMTDLIGKSLVKYETAELLHLDGNWTAWNDLPIRLFTESAEPLSVVWSKFDELWIDRGSSLPFSTEGATARWIENSTPSINRVIGKKVVSVMLGKGEMSVESKPIEIWTRLVLAFDDGWFEIFNALDENGYEYHVSQPVGEFVKCV